VAYLGAGALGNVPPPLPEHRKFLNEKWPILNQKLHLKISGEGHSISILPRPLPWWEGTPLPHPHGASNLVLSVLAPSQNPKYATVDMYGTAHSLRTAGFC